MTTTAGNAATHVVVDERDGYTFWRDHAGVLFDGEAARGFASARNAGMKPEHARYRVFALVAEDAGPWQAGGPLAALFTAATDEEVPAVESAAIRAGLLHKCQDCGAGVGYAGDLCQACGTEIKPGDYERGECTCTNGSAGCPVHDPI